MARPAPSPIIGAVEIGTSKVVALIGEINAGRSLNIIGKGVSSSSGVRKGEVTDHRAATGATHAAILAAEDSAGVEVDQIYLAASGRHLAGTPNTGVAQVSGADNCVSEHDIERAITDAKSRQLPEGRVYIAHVRNRFALDGKPVDEPLGAEGRRLEVGYWSIHGDERVVRSVIRIINGMNAQVQDMIISGVASARAATSEEERAAGCLVIDIGAGTTDYTLYHEGRILRTGVIAVGGEHLTNDLAMGLRVNRKHADYLKLNFGKAMIDREDKHEKVWLIGDLTIGDRSLPRSAIYQILNCRLAELFGIIRKELAGLLNGNNAPAGVVLTGGSSRLPKLADLAAQKFDLPARASEGTDWVSGDLHGPEYATCLGMLSLAFEDQRRHTESAHTQSRGLMRRLTRLFQVEAR